MMKNKKAIEMSFNWIFAIIVGGFILFLAIYSASKFIETGERELSTKTAASLTSLFDPLETGSSSGKAQVINFNKESKIFLDCNSDGNLPFGKQYLSFSEKTFGDQYGEEGSEIEILNKYVFAEEIVEGKGVYVFSKPFFMGYKVADLTMIIPTSRNYCFQDAPEDVQKDLENLNLKNIIFVNKTTKCEGINVCFNKANCDVIVDASKGKVTHKKYDKKVYYFGELIYAAIFSSPENYECNIKRLKSKFNELGKIYMEKIKIMEREGCMPTIGSRIGAVINKEITSSSNFVLLNSEVESFDSVNRLSSANCKLYKN
jgi:hypothetical protein